MQTKSVIEPHSGSVEQPQELPDVNVETYPFDVVQRNLDQAAFLNLFAVEESSQDGRRMRREPDDWFELRGGYGLDLRNILHVFDSTMDPVNAQSGVSVSSVIGNAVGRLQARLLFGSDSTDWAVGAEPPPRIYDPWSSQLFTIVQGTLTLGGDRNEFRVYAVGRTYPVTINGGPQNILCAVGNLSAGSGSFHGLEGTFVMQGSLTPGLGFQGNVTCRVADPDQRLKPQGPLPGIRPIPGERQAHLLDSDAATYIVMRGEKENRSVRTEYGRKPAPGLVSLVTPALMKSVRYGLAIRGGRVLSDLKAGHQNAALTATVSLDLLAPPGSPASPNDFQTRNVYRFVDCDGKPIGSITAFVETGKSFDVKFPKAPGQPGMRYGGFGPILEGTGLFEGVQGTLIVNSAIGIRPHALSMLNVLRIVDPCGRFRAGTATARRDATTTITVTRQLPRDTLYIPPVSPVHASASAPQELPDLNFETNPYAEVLERLDRTAHFNLMSVPAAGGGPTSLRSNGQIVGFAVNQDLYRFDISLQPPGPSQVTATNSVFEHVGTMNHQWRFIPHTYRAFPDSDPPPVRFDPTVPQRFVILDTFLRFQDGGDGFRGFGAGQTFPIHINGEPAVLVAAVGNVTAGLGMFQGLLGTYTYNGTLSADKGFSGHILCRFVDPDKRFAVASPLAGNGRYAREESGVTYLIFRGQKKDASIKTGYALTPEGDIEGLKVVNDLRLENIDFATSPLRTSMELGRIIGKLDSLVDFNPVDPGAPGTPLAPMPYMAKNEFSFFDSSGRNVGGFRADIVEGRTFNMTVAGLSNQGAIRFGGFGPIVSASGVFDGVQGMLTDNSLAGIRPHAISSTYVVRIIDPTGRFRR